MNIEQRLPLPPFDQTTALLKVQIAEDAWNSQDPTRVALAYSKHSEWRNRSQFINGRMEIIQFLTEKWEKELDYRLKKELWAFYNNRIAVGFEYEYHNADGQWFRAYGNENWEFNEHGLITKRFTSINDLPISIKDRRL
jgi:uncharacterized protein